MLPESNYTISAPESEMKTLESYPPSFRHLLHNQTQEGFDSDDTQTNITNPVEDSDPIPTIDLQILDLEELGEVCKDWGVFRLVNHGIPSTLLSQLQEQTKMVFSLPFESKQSTFNNNDKGITYFWGTGRISPIGKAVLTGQQHTNWVEGFGGPLHHLSQFQTQNPIIESFRLLVAEYGNHLFRISTTLFKAMAKNLNLNEDQEHISSLLSELTGSIRIYRYPYCSDANAAKDGLEEHTDSSDLAIILQSQEASGLEVFKDNQWITVKPTPDSLIVNVGDMIKAISDDKYKSVNHKVKLNTRIKDRISICYFVFPDEDFVIKSSKYKPFTYRDFRTQVQQDIKTVGRKIGLARFVKDQ